MEHKVETMMDGISARDTWNLSNRIHCERGRPRSFVKRRRHAPVAARAGAADIDTPTNEQ